MEDVFSCFKNKIRYHQKTYTWHVKGFKLRVGKTFLLEVNIQEAQPKHCLPSGTGGPLTLNSTGRRGLFLKSTCDMKPIDMGKHASDMT